LLIVKVCFGVRSFYLVAIEIEVNFNYQLVLEYDISQRQEDHVEQILVVLIEFLLPLIQVCSQIFLLEGIKFDRESTEDLVTRFGICRIGVIIYFLFSF